MAPSDLPAQVCAGVVKFTLLEASRGRCANMCCEGLGVRPAYCTCDFFSLKSRREIHPARPEAASNMAVETRQGCGREGFPLKA